MWSPTVVRPDVGLRTAGATVRTREVGTASAVTEAGSPEPVPMRSRCSTTRSYPGRTRKETRPSDPYSVQLNYIVRDGKLYIDPAEGKNWLDHLRADPRVRVRFGQTIYDLKAILVGQPGEIEGFDATRFIYRLDARDS